MKKMERKKELTVVFLCALFFLVNQYYGYADSDDRDTNSVFGNLRIDVSLMTHNNNFRGGFRVEEVDYIGRMVQNVLDDGNKPSSAGDITSMLTSPDLSGDFSDTSDTIDEPLDIPTPVDNPGENGNINIGTINSDGTITLTQQDLDLDRLRQSSPSLPEFSVPDTFDLGGFGGDAGAAAVGGGLL